MAEYIKREDVLNKICEDCMLLCDDGSKCEEYLEKEQFLKEIPAADVRPVVHARWDRRYDDFMKSTYDTCSNCGMEYFGAKGFHYCPNCGADMREVDNDTQNAD